MATTFSVRPVGRSCIASIARHTRCLHSVTLRSARCAPRLGSVAFRPQAVLSADSIAPATHQAESSNGVDIPALTAISAPQQSIVFPTEIATPPDTYQKIAALGGAKADMPAWRIMAMALVAAVYISFGALLLLSVSGNCSGLAASNLGLQKLVAGAFGLQFGLLMVIICGAELFTGNTALMAAAYWEGKATAFQVAKNWIVSYMGNLLGCLAMVAVIQATGIFAAGHPAAIGIAVTKTSLTFSQAFIRGILANWLVCIAIWMATSASSLPGKVMGAYFPILTFVCIGLEHSVANMFFIPMGIVLGAPVTWKMFFMANLLPVTLGNIVGGAICMATSYAFIFGRMNPDTKLA